MENRDSQIQEAFIEMISRLYRGFKGHQSQFIFDDAAYRALLHVEKEEWSEAALLARDEMIPLLFFAAETELDTDYMEQIASIAGSFHYVWYRYGQATAPGFSPDLSDSPDPHPDH